MGLPRSRYVNDEVEGVYHCFSRCVRRAFLCGFDPLTGRDFSHRKSWIVERLQYLAAIFAIEVCAYAIMENHYHAILRTRPDLVASWSDRQVAIRWLTLFPKHQPRPPAPLSPTEQQIAALLDRPERIAELRKRLSSLSWFMGRLNEFIARKANKEDDVKGRFWDGRFKCQTLLDEAAIAAGMVYVDLNLIRAGLAPTPEQSNFTSIQLRIRSWQIENRTRLSIPTPSASLPSSPSLQTRPLPLDRPDDISPPISPGAANSQIPLNASPLPSAWLCPISSDPRRRGILEMSEAEYFDLVDCSGRMSRTDKPGAIDPRLAPILLRIRANPQAWTDTISRFGSNFRLAAGLPSHLQAFADQIGSRWLKGIQAARNAFASAPS
jgi:hypothetical protein